MHRLLDILVSGVHDAKNQLFIAESLIAAAEVKHGINLGEARYAIETAANRLSRTIAAYQLLRHDAALAIVPAPVSDLCDEVQLAQSGHLARGNILLAVDCPVYDAWPLDRDLVTDMLNNAVQNAGRHARQQVRLSAAIEGEELVLRVEDDGPGFGPLVDGLPENCRGLAIGQRLAEMHTRHGRQGRLTLTNGGCFGGGVFELEVTLMSGYSSKRFLVVDDQPQAREGLRSIAQTVGAFSVEFAGTYQDAVYRIRNNTPDVVLCDYMLGGGRSGQQLLEEMRRFNLLPDDAIFMMVTGEQAYEQVVAAVELVPDDYIIKPFSPEKLLLRLDRIVAKKKFFAEYYRERRRQDYEQALAVLAGKLDSEEGKPYRFETLRQMAETQLVAGNTKAAEKTYRDILANYDFPWARAGMARALHRQQRHGEARKEIDRVVSSTPNYFDASDLKAAICMAQGEHAEAQRILDDIAKKTPRNFQRKRLLVEAATLNGDADAARTVMADVIANDTMPGAVTPLDQLMLARGHVGAGDLIAAENVLLNLRDADVQAFSLAEQASYVALLAVASPEKGKTRFAGLRPALMATDLPVEIRLDILRAALAAGDNTLADGQAEALMSGPEAKKIFSATRKLYAQNGRETEFRELQKEVALRRIQHETPAAAPETPEAA